jgi:UDP-N-acetylglucosamine--N-acetylmuramyl-(pentapeptide) pyrophosphoryl-undecaprenol N-acetylglucosamine transferase
MGSLLARQVHLAVPESHTKLWRKRNALVSGNPVRRSVEEGDGGVFRRAFDLPPSGPLVVVIGGSQGATALTEAAVAAARRLAAESPVPFVVQTGARTFAEVRAALAADPAPGLVLTPFLDDVGGAYAAATLVVARAGAMTLAELAASGVPSVLVPYPWAAEDHQTRNARRFAANGAALVMPQEQLTGERLARAIRELLRDPPGLARMAQAARGGEEAGARQRIAAACERFLG